MRRAYCTSDPLRVHRVRHQAREKEIHLAKLTLAQDGSSDPHAELALAVATESQAREARGRMEQNAEAIALLDASFATEQEAVASQFAGPLRSRVAAYLHCLFGSKAAVQLDFTSEALGGFGLERFVQNTGAFAFDTLSGGAREQVSAALRLGVADVLAAGHHGYPPVLFDDAFAYSDPSRLEGLQRMLDLAAERGLQVIVLSCNPRDCDRLGATQVLLTRAQSSQPRADSMLLSDAREVEAHTTRPIVTIDPIVAHGDADRHRFLTALRRASGHCSVPMLRTMLGWSDTDFDRVKSELREKGTISIGRGRGGTITLVGGSAS